MGLRLTIWLALLAAALLAVAAATSSSSDPYELLGVGRRASLQDIRRAYKQRAKEWHPDKNEDPSAESKFVEIKQAYELLSDNERRKAYDLHGITSEDNSMYRERHDYGQYRRFKHDPFEEFFGRFHYQDQDITYFHKLSVTTRHFENKLVEKSTRDIVLVLFYSDWCMECLRAAPVWRRLVEALQPRGATLATVHAGHEQLLVRQLGIPSLPHIVLLVDRQAYLYKDSVFSVQKVVEFVRNKLPYKLVKPITDVTVEEFLNGWEDNKVRGLIFEDRSAIRLRYLLTAFHYRDRVTFGFVDLSNPETEKIRERFSVEPGLDAVMIFREDWKRPAATVSMSDIPTATLHQIVSSNQFLTLPRLSSQSILESVCPAEWQGGRRRLCAVLVSRGGSKHAAARAALRRYARSSQLPMDRVRFAHVYMDVQHQFVQALAEAALGQHNTDISWAELRIAIIWRRDENHIRYEWLADPWPEETSEVSSEGMMEGGTDSRLNRTQRHLGDTLRRLLRPSEPLSYEAVVKELIDEHMGSIWSRMMDMTIMMIDRAVNAITRDTILPALSVVATILFILAAGYLMAHLVRLEEESIQKKSSQKSENVGKNGSKASQNNNNNGSPTMTRTTLGLQSELKLHELRAEKYNGLVRLIKPGCRTIVLLVDMQSRDQLLSMFYRIIFPYRKNKTLLFAFLDVERHVVWYRRLLQLSLPEPRELQINPRNCVGTVLSLNGHRKYFCMFHAKHPESTGGTKRMAKMTRRLGSGEMADPEAGAFMGFHSSESSDSESEGKPLLQGTLLDGLENWLDRLFEGSTHRYYINYWPDFTTK